VIHGAPEIVCLAVDPDEDPVQMPTRIRKMMHVALPNLGGEHWTKPVPPAPHRFVADVDAALETDVLDLSQGWRVADVMHLRRANDPRRAIEITEEVIHPPRLWGGSV